MSKVYKIYEYLLKIKNEEATFSLLVNRKLKEDEGEDYVYLRDALKAIVNRYYFFNYEAKRLLPELDESLKDYFIASLGALHCVKSISEEEILDGFKEDLIKFETNATVEELTSALTSLKGEMLVPSEKETSIITKKIALTYAYPEWVVKMVAKHYGIKKAYRAIASSRRTIPVTCNTNLFLTKGEKVAEANQDFEKGSVSDNALRYVGKTKLIDAKEFLNNEVFVEDEASQLLMEKLAPQIGDNTLIVASDKGTLALDCAIRQRDVGEIHVASSNISNYTSTRNMAKRFNIHSLDLFESGIELLLSHVPNNTMDRVLIIPESSSLGLIRRKPEVLLTLKRDSLDEIIAKESASLKEAATFVKNGGRLVYAVFTYSLKETVNIVREFLESNDDFTLVESKQVFANEIPSDGVYYCVLEKKKND